MISCFTITIWLSLLGSFCPLAAQRLLEESMLSRQLSDGTEVRLYRAINADTAQLPYYYAPVNLRISDRNGIQEFSFMAYRKDDGTLQGGIMHWLLTWGLTATQQQELANWLTSEINEHAVLMGSIQVNPKSTPWLIPEKVSITQLLRRSLSTSSDIPAMPGGKMAASFQLNAEDAHIMQQAMQSPRQLKEVHVRWEYTFPLWRKVPSGYIMIQQTVTLQKNLQELINP